MTDRKPVKARYLGATPVVFPHLEGVGPHAGEMYVATAEGEAEFRPEGSPVKDGERILARDASALIVAGDVFPIDRQSAEAREDLELVATSEAPKTARKSASES